MPVEFKKERVRFDTTPRKQTEPVSVTLTRPPRSQTSVQCVLQGFDIRFTGHDRNLHQVAIDVTDPELQPRTAGREFMSMVSFRLRDASGTFDDPFHGWVDVVFIADLE